MKILYRLFFGVVFLLLPNFASSQSQQASNNSVKVGAGLGFIDAEIETGMGVLLFVGYQRSYWNDRFRVNPNLSIGKFYSFMIQDVSRQEFFIFQPGLNAYFDLIKYRSVSLFLGTGVFVHSSIGEISDRYGSSSPSEVEKFHKFYIGAGGTAGIRINPKSKMVAFELRPVSIFAGNRGLVLGYMKLGLDFKLATKESR